jgi:M6 family metalloprotease-like protein
MTARTTRRPLRSKSTTDRSRSWIDALEPRVLLSVSGDGEVAAAAPAGWTTGTKTVLYIRAAYADTPTVEPQSLASAQSNMAIADAFWRENSFGAYSLRGTFSGLVVLPRERAYYDSAGYQTLRNDALSAAAAANPQWNYLNYDLDVVSYIHSISIGSASDPAGRANIGSRGLWLIDGSDLTLLHELGHNIGLFHSNSALLADGVTPFDPIGNKEYGDLWDIMGLRNLGDGSHINAWAKHQLGWISDANVGLGNSSGVYRIYAHDTGGSRLADGDYAVKIPLGDQTRAIWVEYRHHPETDRTRVLQNGVTLRLDNTPIRRPPPVQRSRSEAPTPTR